MGQKHLKEILVSSQFEYPRFWGDIFRRSGKFPAANLPNFHAKLSYIVYVPALAAQHNLNVLECQRDMFSGDVRYEAPPLA